MDFLGAPGFPGVPGPGVVGSQVSRSGVMESLIEAVLAPLGITAGREAVKIIALEVFAQLPEGHLKWAMMNAAVSGVPILNLAISGYQYFCIATMIYDTYVKLRDRGEIPGVPAAPKAGRKRRSKAAANSSSPNSTYSRQSSMDYLKSKIPVNNLVNAKFANIPAVFAAAGANPPTTVVASASPSKANNPAKTSGSLQASWFKNLAVRLGIPVPIAKNVMLTTGANVSSTPSSPSKLRRSRRSSASASPSKIAVKCKIPSKTADYASFYKNKMGSEKYNKLVDSIVRRSMQRKTRLPTPEKSVASNSRSTQSQSVSRGMPALNSPVGPPADFLNETRVVAGTDFDSLEDYWRNLLITVDIVPRSVPLPTPRTFVHPVDEAISRLSVFDDHKKLTGNTLRSALKSCVKIQGKASSMSCSSRRSCSSLGKPKRQVKFHPSAKKAGVR